VAKGEKIAEKDMTLESILRSFEDSFTNSFNERERAQQCRDYYDGFQWTADEIDALQKRKQPIVTANRIRPKVNSLIGFEKRQRTDPKAYPRTPKHEKDANGATDALRFVCDQNNFKQIHSDVAENLFIEGAGAACVGVKPKGDEFDVYLSWVPWDRFYRDPHSRKRDFSDAMYMGEVIWMDEDLANAEYPGNEETIAAAYEDDTTASETYDDRPRLMWTDGQRRRVRILKHRWKDPKKGWMTGILCRGGWLWGPKVSPYVDEQGVPQNDMVAVSAYVTRENDRYGEVYNWLTVQDEVNKRRSKALHRLSVRQVVAEEGAVQNVKQARNEMAKPDGFIVIRPNARFDIEDGLAQMQGEMALLQEAKGELDVIGANPVLQGDTRAPSGRSQEIQTQSALAEYAIVFDALRDWSWRIYKASWCRIRQFWTGPMWIRVTDDEDNLRFVGLNRPVTVMEELQRMEQEGEQPPQELLMIAQQDPNAVARVENAIGELDVDIIVEDGPDSVTIQGEQFEQLVELKKADPTAIPTNMIIEASNLRNKDQILEHLKTSGIPPELQQQMQEMQQALQEAQMKLQESEQKAGQEKQQAQTIQDRTQADIAIAQAQLEAQAAKLQAQRAQMDADQARWELAQVQRLAQPTEQTVQ
jgi:hypothetical protein